MLVLLSFFTQTAFAAPLPAVWFGAPCPEIMSGGSSPFDDLADLESASKTAKTERTYSKLTKFLRGKSPSRDAVAFTEQKMLVEAFMNNESPTLIRDRLGDLFGTIEENYFQANRFIKMEEELQDIQKGYENTKGMAAPQLRARFATAQKNLLNSKIIKAPKSGSDELKLTLDYIKKLDSKIKGYAKEVALNQNLYSASLEKINNYLNSPNSLSQAKAKAVLALLDPDSLIPNILREGKFTGPLSIPTAEDLTALSTRYPSTRIWLLRRDLRIQAGKSLWKLWRNISPTDYTLKLYSNIVLFFFKSKINASYSNLIKATLNANKAAATVETIAKDANGAVSAAEAPAAAGAATQAAGAAAPGVAAPGVAAPGAAPVLAAKDAAPTAAGVTPTASDQQAVTAVASAQPDADLGTGTLSDADRKSLAESMAITAKSVVITNWRETMNDDFVIAMSSRTPEGKLSELSKLNIGTENNLWIIALTDDDFSAKMDTVIAAAKASPKQDDYNDILAAQAEIAAYKIPKFSRRAGVSMWGTIFHEIMDLGLKGGGIYIMSQLTPEVLSKGASIFHTLFHGKVETNTLGINRKIASTDDSEDDSAVTSSSRVAEWQLDANLALLTALTLDYVKHHPEVKVNAVKEEDQTARFERIKKAFYPDDDGTVK